MYYYDIWQLFYEYLLEWLFALVKCYFLFPFSTGYGVKTKTFFPKESFLLVNKGEPYL